jgi:hypothetical protein
MGSNRIVRIGRILVISSILGSSTSLFAWTPFSSLFHGAALESTSTLPNTPLQDLGNHHLTANDLLRAKTNGLRFPELPSIGSGLAHVSGNDYLGITDRGPNGKPLSDGLEKARRTFPLPRFCPSIIRFRLDGPSIAVTESIPLSDSQGNLITGLSNNPGEESLYDVTDAPQPLSLDPNGVDPEAIRVLPDGRFLISEEYSPSILVVSPKGQVLLRYTPIGKPLSGATYPVQAVLPAEFSHRTQNQGFESLALSRDGRFVYAILQSPMLEQRPATNLESRIVRALKIDFTDPLHAFPVAEYLLQTSRGPKSGVTGKREKMSISDAEWIGTDKVIALERSRNSTRLIELDFSKATNILGLPDAKGLHFENPKTNLAAESIKLARITEILSTRSFKSIGSQKLEGLAIIDSNHIAVSNDNDFGLGDNENGEASHVWILKLRHPLPL